MAANELLREQALKTIEVMLEDQLIQNEDMMRFQINEHDIFSAEYIRNEMENWYRTLGIEYLLKKKFSLRTPQFTKEEIKEASDNNEIILCVPQGISRRQLGKLFNIDNWTFENELVGNTPEFEDFWFTTKKTFEPEMLDKTGTEIQRTYKKEGKLGMNLERYLVFIARMRYLTRQTPDTKNKTWLTHGKYEGKTMLIAGFDSKGDFTSHGWLPQFHSPFVGGRYVWIPDHI